MLRGYLNKTIVHLGLWRSIHTTLGVCVLISMCTFVVQWMIPVSIESCDIGVNALSDPPGQPVLLKTLAKDNTNSDKLAKVYRVGLFKASTSLHDKPIANKTIERIKSKLKLQCIMEIDNQLVAYINIKGVGLKKCCVGNSVNDLFTVLNISKQHKFVEISIIDHKITLYL